MPKKLTKEQRYAKTPKGIVAHQKGQAKYDKKRIEGTATIRITKEINQEFLAVQGKNANERLRFLLDK
jgi:hypothetical protein